MSLPLLFDSSYLFVNPRGILMYLYKPKTYDPETIGREICYVGCLRHVKASINSFFLKEKHGSYYKWRLSYWNRRGWYLNRDLEPSFKKLTKVKVL